MNQVSSSDRPLRLLAVTRNTQGASFEHRIANFLPLLSERGIEVDVETYPRDHAKNKRALIRRFKEYEGVWWHKHLLHPFWLGRWRRAAKVVIYDYDDPISFTSRNGGQPSWMRRWKFKSLVRCCDQIVVSSQYLADLARPFHSKVHIVPMAIDPPESVTAERSSEGPIELLWLGSKKTQGYLRQIRKPLEQLGQSHPSLQLRLVAHEPMVFGSLKVDFQQWSPETQERALRECHVGLCPMPDTPWTRGKCPYKVFQYMAYAMPWVGSAVGENLVTAGPSSDDSARGLCAGDSKGWVHAVDRLLGDASWRQAVGGRARAYIQSHHLRSVLADQLAQIIRSACPG